MENQINISDIWPEWEIIEEIGSGSFGTVYKAARSAFGATFFSAVKVIKITLGQWLNAAICGRTLLMCLRLNHLKSVKIWPEHFRHCNGTVFILVVFHHRHQGSAYGKP